MPRLKSFLPVKTRIEVHAALSARIPGVIAWEVSDSTLLCMFPRGNGYTVCRHNFIVDTFTCRLFFSTREDALRNFNLLYQQMTCGAKELVEFPKIATPQKKAFTKQRKAVALSS